MNEIQLGSIIAFGLGGIVLRIHLAYLCNYIMMVYESLSLKSIETRFLGFSVSPSLVLNVEILHLRLATHNYLELAESRTTFQLE